MTILPQPSVSHDISSSAPIPRVSSSSLDLQSTSLKASTVFGSQLKFGEIAKTHLKLFEHFNCRSSPGLVLKASREPPGMTQELLNSKSKSAVETENGNDLFDDLKHRFLSFKRHKYMENIEHFGNLSKAQAPKFMVIACADSRVCPSNILGFQPGEAFMIRNVANLVPPFEKGPSETNAALEFSVNTLEVENIFVIGHSCCGGIRALMSMQDMEDEVNSSSFIRNWVIIGKNAKLSTKAAASSLDFDKQCTHCEKESVNRSLLNLLTYPWIEERVKKGVLSIHGGYYDFVQCTFEKWTLDHKASSFKEGNYKFAAKNRQYWS